MKLFTIAAIFIFANNVNAQKVDISIRYQKENGLYFRINGEQPITKKIFIGAGFNVDSRSLIHVEGGYKLNQKVSLLLGTAYHPYQDGFHPSIGIAFEQKKEHGWEIDAHVRVLFNHLYHVGSEVEALKELNERWAIGALLEAEAGKEFMEWKDAQKAYIPKHPEFEKVFLAGPIAQFKLNKKLFVNTFAALGWQKNSEVSEITYKTGLGFKLIF